MTLAVSSQGFLARPLCYAGPWLTVNARQYANTPLQEHSRRFGSGTSRRRDQSDVGRSAKDQQDPSSSSSSSSSSASSSSASSSRASSTPTKDFYAETADLEGISSLPRTNQTPSFPPRNWPSAFGSNQVLPVASENQQRLAQIISSFSTPIRFAFAYGSGVFPQSASGPERAKRPAIKDPKTGQPKKMVDLVLAVAHPEHWHGLNRQQFPRHYSLLSRFPGTELLMGWVQRAGAGIWYNPYVKVGDELIKYGVIDLDTMCADLLDWDTLYVSGRMHKPVAMLIADPRVRLAQQVNLASALRVALLLLPQNFTEVELYTRIASLSYTGDFRMKVPGGENANKVRNIVLAQRNEFRRLYSGLMRSLGTIDIREHRQDRYAMTQDVRPEVRAAYAARLPLRLREKVVHHYTRHPEQHEVFLQMSMAKKDPKMGRRPGGLPSLAAEREKAEKEASSSASSSSSMLRDVPQELLDDFWLAAVQQPDFTTVLLQLIAQTVKGPALTQSAKGVWTAGVRRTLKYVAAKVGKWLEGKAKTGQKGSGSGSGGGGGGGGSQSKTN